MTKVLLITGAGGFIGKKAVKYFDSKGWKVKAIIHSGKPRKEKNVEFIVGDIRDREFMTHALSGVTHVLHLAARKSDEKDSYSVNVIGSRKLVELAKISGVKKIINVSTASTKISKKGTYGMTKSLADIEFSKSGTNYITLRPSLIYENFNSGMFGTIVKSTQSKVVPVFGNGKTVFWPIHIDDLMKVFEISLRSKLKNREYDIGGEDKLEFQQMIEIISKLLWSEKVRVIKLPIILGTLSAKVMSLIMAKPLFSKSNVLGGAYSAKIKVSDFISETNFKPRSLTQGLNDLNSSNFLKYLEAKNLLEYIAVLSKPKIFVSDEMVSRFLQAQESANISKVFKTISRKKSLIPYLDVKIKDQNNLLQRKLLIASAIIEASPEGARWLLNNRPNYFSSTLRAIVYSSFIFLISSTKKIPTEINEKI